MSKGRPNHDLVHNQKEHTMHKAFLGAISALTLTAASGIAASPCSSSGYAEDSDRGSVDRDAGNGVAIRAVSDHHDKTIVGVAKSAGSFNTLLTAAKAAGLAGALGGDGPLTVLAPTDEAFSELPDGTLEKLLKPENKQLLADILSYHVIPGRVGSDQVKSLDNATTLLGQRIDIKSGYSGLTIDGANVISADVDASNGVIHVIDKVLLPATGTIVETADAAGSFGTLLAAAKAAGLADLLGSEGPYTVFAPTDDAFDKLPEGTVASLLEPQNKDKLASILKYHVVPGRVYADDALKAGSAGTAQGGSVDIAKRMGTVRVNDAKVVGADIETSNGVIHVIDTVLLPE